jgi:hypothetical protein
MKIEEIINDQFIKNKIEEVINNSILSEDKSNVIRLEYPQESGFEWKIICDSRVNNEITIKIKKRV